jgi:metal-responsive CopG/Arc/MetJ family transcriptional regulator
MHIRHMVAKREQATERVVTPMRPKLLERIEDFRYARRIPSRAEAVRQLLEEALRQAEGDKSNCGGGS